MCKHAILGGALPVLLAAVLFSAGSCKPHGGSLSYLDQYVGRTPASVDLWTTEPLQSDLKDQLSDQYKNFINDMARAVPLRKDSILYTYSPLDTSEGYAYLLIDTKTNKFQAGIYTAHSILTFNSPGESFNIPKELEPLLDSIK